MSLLEQIKNKIDSHQVISFDIFDTLLLRPYVKPTDLFAHIEAIFGAKGYTEARIKAETAARHRHRNHEEITFDEIYDEISDTFKALKSKELEFEAQVLQPNFEMQEVFEYAKNKGKTVVIVSDMYLPSEFLAKVLAKKGYTDYDKLFVSSTYRKTKWNGTLFKEVIEELNVQAEDVFHIGDNRQSDYEKATKVGFSAHCYAKPIDTLFHVSERAKRFYENNKSNIGASILTGLLSLDLAKIQYTENSYWNTIGYCYAGPIMYGYMQWFIEHMKNDGMQEVMFLGRDGYTLQKVFDILSHGSIRNHYFYAPRYLNLVCNLDYAPNIAEGDDSGKHALNIIFNYFKEKDDFLYKHAPQLANSAQGDKFIQEHRKLFDKLSEEAANDYKNYLAQFKIKGEKIALVDSCTQMLSAQKILASSLQNKEVKGYYWYMPISKVKHDMRKYKTATYQKTRNNNFVDWNIMELFMTAPNPSVHRIENGEPVFKKPTEQEAQRMRIYPSISSGAVEFAQCASRAFDTIPTLLSAELLTNWINIFCTVYTTQDKEEFLHIQHAWDAEHTNWVPVPRPWFEAESESHQMRNALDIKLFGIPFIRIKQLDNVKRFYLFRTIPFMRIKRRPNRQNLYLFGIPLIGTKFLGNGERYKLFNIIPLLTIKRG